MALEVYNGFDIYDTYRYVKNPSLYAVELINEPVAPRVSLEILNKYYKAGYEAVRKHSNALWCCLTG